MSELCGALAIDFRHCDTQEIQLAYENLAIRLCSAEAYQRVLLRIASEDWLGPEGQA